MPLELSYLTASIAVYGVMILVQAAVSNLSHGAASLAGARDRLGADSLMEARAKRASQNMVEALLLFAPLVLVAHATGRLNEMTELGAGLFLGARIAYAPLYWLGVPWLRSLAWALGFVGTLLVFLQVLPFSGGA
ncbi:MAG: hypothetical protein GVY06_03735 [Alphaproteobacteria bacterium]|jgi:uncharacterized MAPEG superfamily protein|nr:hypothetical protein [Alphaproteobacteria bacterium]